MQMGDTINRKKMGGHGLDSTSRGRYKWQALVDTGVKLQAS